METGICPVCNNPIMPGGNFCDVCGHPLTNVPSAPIQPESEANLASPPPPSGSQPVEETWVCTNCGTTNPPGAVSCEHCSTPLRSLTAPGHTPVSIPRLHLEPYSESDLSPAAFLTGSFVIQNSNISLPIPQGITEAIIGREDPASNIFPEIDLDPYGGHEAGVGRQHARLVIEAGLVCMIDLSSVNGSYINNNKIIPGQPQPIQDGDEVRLGHLTLIYHAG